MGTWMKFRLMASGDPEDELDIRAIVGEVRKPGKMPWWMADAFATWQKHTKSGRDLEWEDFPLQDFVDTICSMNRPIPVWKPLFPRQRLRYAFGSGEEMNEYEARMKDMMEQGMDPSSSVDENWLRELGFILDEDLEKMGEGDVQALMAKGFKRINLADGTTNSLMPWDKKSYMSWVPLSNPETPKPYQLQSKNVLGHVDWNVTPEWMSLVDSIWGPSIQTGSETSALTTEV